MGKKKKPKINKQISNEKNPTLKENAESYKKKTPSWKFAKNKNHEYDRWKILYQDIEKINSIIDSLANFEGMTWQEIETSNGGKNKGTNSHFIDKKDLCKDAQEYMEKYQLDDTIFSLRISGKERLFGQIENGIFIIHWFDAEHEICPLNKKHT